MFLELCLEALGSSPVATVTSGNSGLLSICEGPSGLFSSHGSDIGPHLDLRKLTQGSSLVETVFSGFLLSFNRGVRAHLVLRHGTLLFNRFGKRMSGLLLN